jgi:DNA-binding beta-propeller fold protein YncE
VLIGHIGFDYVPCEPDKRVLIISGTSGNDVIEINGPGNILSVKLNGVLLGQFDITALNLGAVRVLGLEGDDKIKAGGSVDLTVEEYGQLGNDSLEGGGGDDILFGGEGNDVIDGHKGRDLVFAGLGTNSISGGSDDDIIIAGTTAWDNNPQAICAIHHEWIRTDRSYAERVADLRDGGGYNGNYVLNQSTVFENGTPDTLAGAKHMDWFFYDARDKMSDRQAGEVATPLTSALQGPTKFFVTDIGDDDVYRYSTAGSPLGQYPANAEIAEPRGIASNASGDTLWVIDAKSKRVSVQDPTGKILGLWQTSGLDLPTGITTNGTDLWMVDMNLKQVLLFAGGAARLNGSAGPTSFFKLHVDNSKPSDVVTDGNTIWVTDEGRKEVFVYALNGTLKGRWKLDARNGNPSGITLNPAGGTDLWVLDREDKAVYRYATGRTQLSGSLVAADLFVLNGLNTSPEAIADPPVGSQSSQVSSGEHGAAGNRDSDLHIGLLMHKANQPALSLSAHDRMTEDDGGRTIEELLDVHHDAKQRH